VDGDIPAWSETERSDQAPSVLVRLSEAGRGDRGVVLQVCAEPGAAVGDLEQAELERRLLEIGFGEGARIEVLHEGFIRRDPIAVKLDDMRVALRRREARGILVQLDAEGNHRPSRSRKSPA